MPRCPRNTRALWQAILLVCACLALSSQRAVALDIASPAPRTDSSALEASVRDGRLSVQAREQSWQAVVEAVRQKTGIRLHSSMPLEGTVTVSCTDLSVERTLKCLFGPDANFLLFYRGAEAQSTTALPVEVWVLGKGPETVTSTAPKESETIPSVLDDPTAAEVKQAFERNPQVAREAALHAGDVEMRLLAIAYLGQQAQGKDLRILADIVGDPDPHIRQSAVEALGPLVREDPQVQQALAHVMETTADPEIRQLAADTLGVPLDAPTDAVAPAATTAGVDQ